jgi:hypothetical protein
MSDDRFLRQVDNRDPVECREGHVRELALGIDRNPLRLAAERDLPHRFQIPSIPPQPMHFT